MTAPSDGSGPGVQRRARSGDERKRERSLRTRCYAVSGLSSVECVTTLTEEASALPGVRQVVVTLVVGGESRMSLTGTENLALETVGLAVDEAGFELLGPLL